MMTKYQDKVWLLAILCQIIIFVDCTIRPFSPYQHYEMGYVNVEKFTHSKLQIEPFLVTEVENHVECADACLMADPNIDTCQGFNMYVVDEKANISRCELLARHRLELPSSLFVRRAGWDYYQPVVYHYSHNFYPQDLA